MATYIFHRFIKAKAKLDNFFCLNGYNWNLFFTEMFIEKCSTFHMAFVQIAEFDWLPGQQKGIF